MGVFCVHLVVTVFKNIYISTVTVQPVQFYLQTSLTNFMVAPCIHDIKHFIVQLMHTNCKILRLLK